MKLSIILVFVVVFPFLVQFACKKEYKVHNHGAILISGASTGIGKHAAVDLAHKGYTVFAGVRKQSDADSMKKEALELGNIPLIPIILDVTNTASITASFIEVQKYTDGKNLPFVGLVNNAGISQSSRPVELVDMSKAEQEFQVNYFGTLKLTKQFLPLLRKHTGRVVSIGSLAGIISPPHSAVYSGTKFAVEAFNDALRREVAIFGVSVSLVEPAYVVTEIGSKALGEGSPLVGLTNEERTLYAHTLVNADAKRVKNFAGADTPTVTTGAVVHALLDPYPNTRYLVARVGKFPASLIAVLVNYLPDRLVDAVLKTMN